MDKLSLIKQKIAEFEAKSAAKEEIKAFTTLVLSVLKTSKETFDSVTKENLATISEALKYLETEHEKLENNVSQVTEDAKKDFQESLSEIKKLVSEVKNIPPVIVEKTEVIRETPIVTNEIKEVAVADTGEAIVDKINALSLEEENKIDASHIRNLPATTVKGGGVRLLQYLADVNIQSPTNNDVLKYNSTSRLWENGTGGSGASAFTDLIDVPNSYSGQSLKVVRVNAGETGLEFTTLSGGGDALTSNPLSQFASTTSAQLAGVISDETGSGVLVFDTNPTFTTRINAPEVKATGSNGVTVANNAGTAVADFGTGGSTNSTIHGAINIGTDSADYIQLTGGTGTVTNTATGSSTDIDMVVVPKGAGKFKVTGNANISGLTASQLLATNASKDLVSLDTATYPSLTELSYVKGVTSAIQTQLNAKALGATTITIAGTANQITSSAGAQDLSANRTWTLSFPADVIIPTVLTVPNTGLHLLDTNASHDLIIAPGSNLTADHTLTLTTGDADRTIDLGANFTLPADPNADRILFWDDSAGATAYLAVGNSIAITTTTIDTIQDIRTSATPSFTGANLSAGTATLGTVAGAIDAGGATSLEVPNGAGGTTVNATGEVCVDSTSKTLNFYDGASEVVLNPIRSKSITIESPTATEDLSMFYTDDAITITKIVFVITGSTSVTTTIRQGTDRSATGTEVVTGGTVANSTTTGNVVTSFNDATVPADSFIWLETTALSGTPTSLNVTIFYTQDA